MTSKNKGKKRKIAETSNVITETLPSAEGAQVSTNPEPLNCEMKLNQQ